MNGLWWNYHILITDIAWGLQRLSLILENIVPLNFYVSKAYLINKSCRKPFSDSTDWFLILVHKKGTLFNFCTFEIASLVNVPENHVKEYTYSMYIVNVLVHMCPMYCILHMCIDYGVILFTTMADLRIAVAQPSKNTIFNANIALTSCAGATIKNMLD